MNNINKIMDNVTLKFGDDIWYCDKSGLVKTTRWPIVDQLSAHLKEHGLMVVGVRSQGEDSSWRTAITRGTLSAPSTYLKQKRILPASGRILDYGCGKGGDVNRLKEIGYNIEGYDPHFRPDKPKGKYDCIICNYVLNVVGEGTQAEVLDNIRWYLKDDGVAYVAVRRDLPRHGTQSKYCNQRYVELNEESVYRCTGFEIYKITKGI